MKVLDTKEVKPINLILMEKKIWRKSVFYIIDHVADTIRDDVDIHVGRPVQMELWDSINTHIWNEQNL